MLAQMLVGDRIKRTRPYIKSAKPEQKRHEKHRHHRDATHGCAQDSANYHPPCAFGQMPKHKYGHRSQGHAQPGHKSHEVGAEKFVRTNPRPQGCDHSEDQANDQRPLLDGLDHRRRHQVQITQRSRVHFGSSWTGLASGTGKVAPEPGSWNCGGWEGTGCPAGTSAVEASWLNCRARM